MSYNYVSIYLLYSTDKNSLTPYMQLNTHNKNRLLATTRFAPSPEVCHHKFIIAYSQKFLNERAGTQEACYVENNVIFS